MKKKERKKERERKKEKQKERRMKEKERKKERKIQTENKKGQLSKCNAFVKKKTQTYFGNIRTLLPQYERYQ